MWKPTKDLCVQHFNGNRVLSDDQKKVNEQEYLYKTTCSIFLMNRDTKDCLAIIGLSCYFSGTVAALPVLDQELQKAKTAETLQEFPREVRRFTSLPHEIDEIKTPLQARRWLDENLSRGEDSVLYNTNDFFAPCGLTYQKGKGDCDDYAICAAALLQGDVQQSYFAILLTNRDEESRGHLAYVYQLNNRWGVIGAKPSEFDEPFAATPEKALWYRYNFSHYDIDFHQYILLDHSGLDLLNGNQDLKEKITQKIVRHGSLE